jgi:hypothetical protein
LQADDEERAKIVEREMAKLAVQIRTASAMQTRRRWPGCRCREGRSEYSEEKAW